ncbi:hypothetical protein CXG81DRAFT_11574 [Caulochytrium protostelioides]|uniref:serine--tRNA ligase n=1 Tax=Caulochytrium protostelioides TaxID=1555241 RepID=A0A4P9X9T5_9FUNG|nr:hypothetical protein CXG81DRAFT_11574 [Caulochytrium protostelioides]|eukprot:RKP01781.1 hypothetical protein CXG81DRAFT_11574 [Caulochytrium protostelioides]
MGIDINHLRPERGGNPELVKASQRARAGEAGVALVDEVMALDEAWRKLQFQAAACNTRINAINKEIGALMKAKKADETAPLKAQKVEAEADKVKAIAIAAKAEADLNSKLNRIGNIVDPTVPVSLTEDDNALVHGWWPAERSEEAERQRKKELGGPDGRTAPGLRSHHEVLEMIEGYDAVRGVNVAGHRAYFLTGPGVDFNLALIRYGLDFLANRQYKKIWTPFMMKREIMAKTAQLEEFDEALYKVSGEAADPSNPDADDKYLIATAEQPLSALHMNEWFTEPAKELPIRYAGQSTCFRKEAGSHGRDTWGIFRVHQFEKVEQFVLCKPEDSPVMHEEMLQTARDFYESLGLPYRVINIVSGALNNAAAKKYDLEAWFPFQCDYKELVSCSNCTDYQSRPLEIRLGTKKQNDNVKNYVHCLNCTLVATERTLCCLLENYQTEDGVTVPPVLRPYMNNVEFIPYTKPPPKTVTPKVAVPKKNKD